MAISFAQLRFAEVSLQARRLLWHVLSIGSVSRDEPERHEGLDKAGLFLFQVSAGAGRLEVMGKNHLLERGDRCWLVDLRHQAPLSQREGANAWGGRTVQSGSDFCADF